MKHFLFNLTKNTAKEAWITGGGASQVGNNSDLSPRLVRLDSVSILSRQSDLRTYVGRIAAILVLVLTIGIGQAWGTDQTYTISTPTAARNVSGNVLITGTVASKKVKNTSSTACFYVASGSYAPVTIASKSANIKSITIKGNRDTGSSDNTTAAFNVLTSSDLATFTTPTDGFTATKDNNGSSSSVASLSSIPMVGNNQSYVTEVTISFDSPVMGIELTYSSSTSFSYISVTYDDAITAPSVLCEAHATSTTAYGGTGCTVTTDGVQSGVTISSTYYYNKLSGDAKYIKLDLGSGKSFAVGDEIWIECNGNGIYSEGAKLNSSASATGATAAVSVPTIGSGMPMWVRCVTVAASPWKAQQSLYVLRNSSNSRIYQVEVRRPAGKAYTVSTAVYGGVGGTVSASASSLDKDETTTITATPATGYQVTNWAVSGTGASVSPSGASNSNTTTLTMGTENATVTATFGLIDYSVSKTLTNCAVKDGSTAIPSTMNYGDDLSTIIEPTTGNLLPGSITVSGVTSYTWNALTGALTLTDVTGAVSISISAGSPQTGSGATVTYAMVTSGSTAATYSTGVFTGILSGGSSNKNTLVASNTLSGGNGVGVQDGKTTPNNSRTAGMTSSTSAFSVGSSPYAEFTFDVVDGYTFTPTAISVPVLAITNNAYFTAIVTDGSSTWTSATSECTQGTQATINATPSGGSALTGTVNIRVFCHNQATAAKGFRIGTGSVTITGTVASAAPSCTAPDHVGILGSWRYFPGQTISLTATGYDDSDEEVVATAYQWQKEVSADNWSNLSNGTAAGVTISGATSSNLQISNCGTGNTGNYRCIVSTGATCSTTSSGYGVKIYTLNGAYDDGEFSSNNITFTSGTTGTATVHLAAGRVYKFKVTDNFGTWFGNSGGILEPAVNWDFSSGEDDNCVLFTGPEGDYTFTVDIDHVTYGTPEVVVSVAYPSVTHPSAGYAYFKNVDNWTNVALHMWYDGGGAYTEWASDPWVTKTTTICGETYYYTPFIPSWYNRCIFHNAGGDGQTGDITVANLAAYSGKYNDKSDANWHDFATYDITFDKNGADGGTDMTAVEDIVCNGSVTLDANTWTKTGYSFNGWKDGSSNDYADEATISNICGDIELTAQWNVQSYNLTWNLGGGTTTTAGTGIASGVSVNTTSSVAYGTSLTAPTVTKANYDFSAWSPAVASTMPAAATTYTATWTAQTHDVAFTLSNAAYSSGTDEGSDVATYGTNYSVTFAATSGYIFPSDITVTIGGETKTKDTHYTWDSSTGELTVTGSYITGDIAVSITALEDVYRVTYSKGSATGGTAPTDATDYDPNDSVVVKDTTGCSFVYAGYTFRGWTDGTTFYKVGQKFKIISDVTLTAVWDEPVSDCKTWSGSPNTFTDGSMTVSTNLILTSGSISNPSSEDIYSGTKATCFVINGSDKYLEGHLYDGSDISSVTISAATNQSSAQKYAMVFSTSSDFSSTVTVYEHTAPSKDDARDDSKLIHEFTAPSGAKYFRVYRKFVYDKTQYGENQTIRVYGVEVCKAGGGYANFTVSFADQTGFAGSSTLPGSIVGVPTGKKIIQPANPTATGYIFGGWYSNAACTSGNEINWSTMTISADKTIYAKWTAKSTPTAYDVDGESTGLCGEETATITLANSQTGISYQLYKGDDPVGAAVSGSTGSELVWEEIDEEGTYTIWTVENATYASAKMGTTGHTQVTVTAVTPTNITTDPTTSVNAVTGVNFTLGLGMEAAGENKTYKWYSYENAGDDEDDKDRVEIDGETGATYTTSKSAGTYYYRVQVIGDCGDDYSEMITVTVVPTYTVTYSLNGGEYNGSSTAPTQAAVASGTSITLPSLTPTKEGYVFASWKCSVGNTYHWESYSYTMTAANTTFTAQWVEAADLTSGTLYMVDDIKPLSVNAVLSSTGQYAKGISSNGCFTSIGDPLLTSAAGGTFEFKTETKQTVDEIDFTEHMWFKGESNVTSNVPTSRGLKFSVGAAGTLSVYCTRGDRISLSDGTNTPVALTSSTSGNIVRRDVNISAAGTYYLLSTEGSDGIAGMKFLEKTTFTVTYADGGATSGSVPVDASSPYDEDAEVTVLGNTGSLAKTGYTFAGWSDGVNTYTAGNTFSMPAEDITLTAQWTLNSHTLDWNFDGGETSATEGTNYTAGGSVNYGTAITYPADNTMSKEGCDFAGWSTDASTMPDENLTITAQWATVYRVSYDVMGGDALDPAYDEGSTANKVTLPEPTRTGYDFLGWYNTSGVKVGDAGEKYGPTARITLYAKWQGDCASGGGSGTTIYKALIKTSGLSTDKTTIEGLSGAQSFTTSNYLSELDGGTLTLNINTAGQATVQKDSMIRITNVATYWTITLTGGNSLQAGDIIRTRIKNQTGYLQKTSGSYSSTTDVELTKNIEYVTVVPNSLIGATTLYLKAASGNMDLTYVEIYRPSETLLYMHVNDGLTNGNIDTEETKQTAGESNLLRAVSGGDVYTGATTAGHIKIVNTSEIQLNNNTGYIKLVLPKALAEGDVLYFRSSHNYELAITSGDSRDATIHTASKTYTIPKSSTLIDKSTIYLWYYSSSANVKTLAVVRPNSAGSCYTVTYHGNGATSGYTNDPEQHTAGSDVPVLNNNIYTGFKRTDYVFNGWNTATDGSGTHYDYFKLDCNTIEDIDDDVNLYAEWKMVISSDNEDFEGFDDPTEYKDVIVDGATLTITEATEIRDITLKNGAILKLQAATEAHDVAVESGSTLNINTTNGDGTGSGVTFTINSLYLRGGWDDTYWKYDMPRVYIDPLSTLTKEEDVVNFDISVDSRNYYPIAVPFRVKVSDVDYANSFLAGYSNYGAAGQYVIKEYNGERRAEKGPDQVNNWKVVPLKDDENKDVYLEPGKGYIMTAVSLPDYGGGVIRFPLSFGNDWTALGEQETIDDDYFKNVIAVSAYTGKATEGDKNANKGWNLLAVPFMSCYATGSDMYAGEGAAAIMQGKFNFEDGTWDGEDKVRYVNVPVHDFSEYIQTDITDAGSVLRPGWCFFVQIDTTGNLKFLTADQAASSSLPIYAPRREQTAMPTVETGIILSDGEKSDKTTILVSDKYSATEYEINADLEKLFGNGYTLATYSLSGETRLAYNALSNADAANIIPIGYRAPADGEYTFSINPRYAESDAFEHINLIDYTTGIVTDLLQSSYTFSTERTQNDARFALNVVPRQETPTDLEDVQGGDVQGTKVRKMIINDQLFIIRDGQMYDATGRMVK